MQGSSSCGFSAGGLLGASQEKFFRPLLGRSESAPGRGAGLLSCSLPAFCQALLHVRWGDRKGKKHSRNPKKEPANSVCRTQGLCVGAPSKLSSGQALTALLKVSFVPFLYSQAGRCFQSLCQSPAAALQAPAEREAKGSAPAMPQLRQIFTAGRQRDAPASPKSPRWLRGAAPSVGSAPGVSPGDALGVWLHPMTPNPPLCCLQRGEPGAEQLLREHHVPGSSP